MIDFRKINVARTIGVATMSIKNLYLMLVG
jgi:hypothetical protein